MADGARGGNISELDLKPGTAQQQSSAAHVPASEEFERKHHAGWDLRIFIREYIFLYVARFGTNRLPMLQFDPGRPGTAAAPIEAKVC